MVINLVYILPVIQNQIYKTMEVIKVKDDLFSKLYIYVYKELKLPRKILKRQNVGMFWPTVGLL